LNFKQWFEQWGLAMLSQESDRFARDQRTVPLPCPNCGRTMQLTRSTAHTGGICEIRNYGCAECGLWTTEDAIGRWGDD
jgi:C4-type Zn-finger protein